MPVEVILSLQVIFEILKTPFGKFTFLNIHSKDSGFNCLGYCNNESINSDVSSHTVERRAFVGGMCVAKQ
jgi:hypothetical protein